MNINIRKAEEKDCKALAAISAEAFTQPMSEAEFGRELATKFSRTLIAETGGDIVGFINIWLISGEADLNKYIRAEKIPQNEGRAGASCPRAA